MHREYEILDSLAASGGKCPASFPDSLDDAGRAAWENLSRLRYVDYCDGVPDGLGGMQDFQSVCITRAGMQAYLTEKERLQQLSDEIADKAKEKSEQKRMRVKELSWGWWQAVILMLLGAICAQIPWGGVFSAVADWCRALFRQLAEMLHSLH